MGDRHSAICGRPLAHRGLRLEPGVAENSMTAFKKAIERGYNIETDAHLLKTGEVALFHDETLRRICGKSARIGDLSLDDVRGSEYLLPNGERIPLLSDLLDLIKGTDAAILLEIKFQRTQRRLEKAMLDLVKGMHDRIAINSFDPYAMEWWRNNAPEFERGYVSCSGLFPLSRLKMNDVMPDFLSFNVGGITPRIKKYAVSRGIKLIAWTVNTEKKLKRALEAGADNIIAEKIDPIALGYRA